MLNIDIKLLELLEFFVTKYNYVLVSFGEEAVPEEVWLVKPESSKYQLIRLTTNSIEQVRFEETKIERVRQILSSNIKRELEFLDIHVGKDEVYENEIYNSVVIDAGHYSGINLNPMFPGISSVIHEIRDNQEVKDITSRITAHLNRSNARDTGKNRKKPLATYIIMAICVLIFGLISLTGSVEDGYVSAGIVFGAYYKAFILGAHEYWRLFTNGFVHMSILHLLMNMYSFFYLGTYIEKRFGSVRLLILLFAGIIGGSLFVFINQGNIVASGLSCGIFALIGSYVVDAFDTGLIKNRNVRNGLILNLVLIAVISFQPNISVLGHLGGFVTGVLLSISFMKNKKYEVLRRNSIAALVVFAIALSVLAFNTEGLDNIYGGTDSMVYEQLREFNLDSYADHLQERMYDFYMDNIE